MEKITKIMDNAISSLSGLKKDLPSRKDTVFHNYEGIDLEVKFNDYCEAEEIYIQGVDVTQLVIDNTRLFTKLSDMELDRQDWQPDCDYDI